jgi:hypothetical protein
VLIRPPTIAFGNSSVKVSASVARASVASRALAAAY